MRLDGRGAGPVTSCGAGGEPRRPLAGEDEFCAGDQKDDCKETLDYGVRESAAAEIGTRSPANHDRHRQCECERGKPPGAGEIAAQARSRVHEDEESGNSGRRLGASPAYEQEQRGQKDAAPCGIVAKQKS